jgi:hypothetical protein
MVDNAPPMVMSTEVVSSKTFHFRLKNLRVPEVATSLALNLAG